MVAVGEELWVFLEGRAGTADGCDVVGEEGESQRVSVGLGSTGRKEEDCRRGGPVRSGAVPGTAHGDGLQGRQRCGAQHGAAYRRELERRRRRWLPA